MRNRNILIVFSGKAQSGKTTCATILKSIVDDQTAKDNEGINSNRLGDSRVQIFSFASALKNIACQYFDWDGSKENVMLPRPEGMLDGPDQIPAPDKGRQLLINIGKKFREIRPSIWLDYVINTIKKIDKSPDTPYNSLFLIDDLRYKNELNLSKTFHSCVSVRISRKVGALDLDDQSEKDLDDACFDFYVENDGTQDELKEKLIKLYQDIMNRYNDPSYKFADVKYGDPKADELEKSLKNIDGWSQ